MLRRGNISSKDTIRFHALKHSPVFLWSVMKGHGVPHNATAHRHSIVAQALTILAEEYVIGVREGDAWKKTNHSTCPARARGQKTLS